MGKWGLEDCVVSIFQNERELKIYIFVFCLGLSIPKHIGSPVLGIEVVEKFPN